MESYLIVKLGALGDVVMCTTLLKEIREQKPEAEVVWVVGEKSLPLLQKISDNGLAIDKLIPVNEQALYNGTLLSKIKEVFSIWKQLIGKHFSQCFIPYRDWRYFILSAPTLCFNITSFNSHQNNMLPGRFHPDLYRGLFQKKFDTPLSPATLPHLSVPHSNETVPEVLLLPGGACNSKSIDALRRWPIEHYKTIARLLFERGYSVGLIGDQNDEWVLDEFKDIPVTSYIGKTSISHLLSILSSTKVLVTHDSGPMHLMRLMRGKVVALFGPTLRHEKFLTDSNSIPLTSHDTLSCSPCYDGKKYAKCTNPICMKKIEQARVLNAVLSLVEQ